MKQDKVLIGQATPEQIAEWKRKHGEVYACRVKGNITYLRIPSFDDINYATSKADADKPLDYWQKIAETTYLGGSEEVLKQVDLFLKLMSLMKQRIEEADGELLEL